MNNPKNEPMHNIELYLESILDGASHPLPKLTAEEAELLNFALENRQMDSLTDADKQASKALFAQHLEQMPVAAQTRPSIKEIIMNLFTNTTRPYLLAKAAIALIVILGAASFVPSIRNLILPQKVSAQSILTNLANHISDYQNSDAILHRKERTQTCILDDKEQNLCTTKQAESWNLGTAYLIINQDGTGKALNTSMLYDSWFYGYETGAKKAAKAKTNGTGQPILLPGASTANDRQTQDDVILKFKTEYGNATTLGQEKVDGHDTYKLKLLPPAGQNSSVTATVQNNSASVPQITYYVWVDTKTYSEVKYEEWITQNGKDYLSFSSEMLINETLPKTDASKVFKFNVPSGVELVDISSLMTTSTQINDSSDPANNYLLSGLTMAQIVAQSPIPLWMPAQLPSSVKLEKVAYSLSPASLSDYSPRDFTASPETFDASYPDQTLFSLSYGNTGIDVDGLHIASPNAEYYDLIVCSQDPMKIGQFVYGPFELASMTKQKNQTIADKQISFYLDKADNSGKQMLYMVWQQDNAYFVLDGDSKHESEMIKILTSLKPITAKDTATIAMLQKVADAAITTMSESSTGSSQTVNKPSFPEIVSSSRVDIYYPTYIPTKIDLRYLNRFSVNDFTSSFQTSDSSILLTLTVRNYSIGDTPENNISIPDDMSQDQVQALLNRPINVKVGNLDAQLWALRSKTSPYPNMALIWREKTNNLMIITTGISEEDLLKTASNLRIITPQDTDLIQTIQTKIAAVRAHEDQTMQTEALALKSFIHDNLTSHKVALQYPTYLPADYSLGWVSAQSDTQDQSLHLTFATGSLKAAQRPDSIDLTISMDRYSGSQTNTDPDSHALTIGGHDAVMTYPGGKNDPSRILYWNIGNVYYSIMTNKLSDAEIVKVAESVADISPQNTTLLSELQAKIDAAFNLTP